MAEITAAIGLRASAVAAGGAHSLLLTERGDVYGCGRNTDGELGYTLLHMGIPYATHFRKA